MSYAELTGEQPPDQLIKMPPGQAIAGAAIGILVLDLWYPLLPGNVANASTFEFPVQYHVMRNTTIPMIHAADPALLDHILEGARKLVQQGARAIVGACGYFANYQKEAASALPVPVFLSSLLQLPVVLQALQPNQRVGIVCANEAALTDHTLASCGVQDRSQIVVTGAQSIDEFRSILDCTGEFNSRRMEQELVSLTREFVERHPDIGAVLLECSDMPPYARAIQNAIRRPVFDFITMIDWIQRAVVRKPFRGFI
jgi:hypothetical protein